MDVDGHPPTHTAGTSAVPSAQVALTPFNHSPMTDKGRQIVARARAQYPHLVASPPTATRDPSPSRVWTFMQGRTRPVTSSPSSQRGAPAMLSTSPQADLGPQPMTMVQPPPSASARQDGLPGASMPPTLPSQLAAKSPRTHVSVVLQPATPPQQASSPQPQQAASSSPEWLATQQLDTTSLATASLQWPTGQPAIGPVHRPALQQPAIGPVH
jgi:hypothetical protein